MSIQMVKNTFLLAFFVALLTVSFNSNSFAQTAPPSDINLTELRSWLQSNWYNGYHDGLGYNEGRRQMYGYIDISGGQIECVYTGFTQAGGYITYPNPCNAEHLIPQSFFGSSEPMKSDVHILKPCHGSANSARSNKPYGEVNDSQAQWYGSIGNSYTSQSNMPSNSDDWSESSGGVWEPREERKGDVARAVFYFYTMYPNEVGPISEMGNTETLLQWHLDDPADATEISRNTKVASQQGNRNPYIDYPDLAYRAWLWDGSSSDTDGPSFEGTPSAITIECGDNTAFNAINATTNDPCSPVTLTYSDASSSVGCGGGNVTRTYSASDGCGNTSYFTQTITFTDTTAPFFTSTPDDITTSCDSELSDLGTPLVADLCSQVNISTNVEIVGGPCPEAYEVHRTFTAIDACGNTSSALQTIYVEASVVVGCPEDVDGDGAITVNDLLAILSEFGCSTNCQYDINQDGIVGVGDILEVLAAFGDAC
tara:strand:- start:7201 stop:8646 length:1446 start_codon:yes stop_codon:yes gene_type:complete